MIESIPHLSSVLAALPLASAGSGIPGEFPSTIAWSGNYSAHDDERSLSSTAWLVVRHPEKSSRPFSRKCACLWRQIYGARRGHFHPAAVLAWKKVAALKRSLAPRHCWRSRCCSLGRAVQARALPVQRCILAQARFGALGGMMRCRSFTDDLWATSPAWRRFGPRQAALS